MVYDVAGQRHQTGEACGIVNNQNVPCPPLGARRYVYFSPEAPSTQQVTAVPVPDSVRTIPPPGLGPHTLMSARLFLLNSASQP